MYTDYARQKKPSTKKFKYRHGLTLFIIVLAVSVPLVLHYIHYKNVKNKANQQHASATALSPQKTYSAIETKKIKPMQFDFYHMLSKEKSPTEPKR